MSKHGDGCPLRRLRAFLVRKIFRALVVGQQNRNGIACEATLHQIDPRCVPLGWHPGKCRIPPSFFLSFDLPFKSQNVEVWMERQAASRKLTKGFSLALNAPRMTAIANNI